MRALSRSPRVVRPDLVSRSCSSATKRFTVSRMSLSFMRNSFPNPAPHFPSVGAPQDGRTPSQPLRCMILPTGFAFGKLEVDLELDLLAHQDAAGVERHIPVEAPVAAIDRARQRATDFAVAGGIDAVAAVLVVELDLVGDALDREIGDDLVAISLLSDLLGLEDYRGVVLDIEEIRAPEVLVAIDAAGVDAGQLDLHPTLGRRDVAGIALDLAGKTREPPSHLRQPHVAHHEGDARVGPIDRPGHGYPPFLVPVP